MGEKVLDGIRVIDWTVVVAGPATSAWLGSFGAEVIKVEQAQTGDPERYAFGGLYGVPRLIRGQLDCWFEQYNVNKKSLTVNLKKEKGREIIYRLIKKSDVFLTNLVSDTVEKLGMDYEMLSKINPRLIYATNTIHGPEGPDRLAPGFDPLAQARGGILTTNGERGQPPLMAPVGISDLTSALSLAFGIMMALFHRERTGVGQWVQTSQLQTCVNVTASAIIGMYLLHTDEERKANPYGCVCRAPSREDTLNPVTTMYRCKDDKWIFLTAFLGHQWPPVARAIGRPELINDPRFVTLEKRQENRKELSYILEEVFAQRTYSEWKEKLRAAGDVPFSPVNTVDAVVCDEQVVANDYLISFDHPVLGRVQLPGMPCTLTKTPGSIESAAPALGQHTEEILLEIGYSWEDIDKLRGEEVI